MRSEAGSQSRRDSKGTRREGEGEEREARGMAAHLKGREHAEGIVTGRETQSEMERIGSNVNESGRCI